MHGNVQSSQTDVRMTSPKSNLPRPVSLVGFLTRALVRGYVHHLKVPLVMHGDFVDSTSRRLHSQSAIIFFVECGISQGHVWKGRDSKNPQCQSPGPPQTVLVAEDLATTERFCSGC